MLSMAVGHSGVGLRRFIYVWVILWKKLVPHSRLSKCGRFVWLMHRVSVALPEVDVNQSRRVSVGSE